MKKVLLICCLIGLFTTGSIFGQQRTITGTVKDKFSGTTIPGATILEKGTSNGTTTDLDGKYSITISDKTKSLVFSFVGLKAMTLMIGESNVLNASMEEENIGLEEVVVIGYGAVKKSDLTGSVSSVKMDKLEEIPANSFDKKIQGRMPGVRVTSLSSQPGGATSIRVRGGNSIMSGNEPLYIIDGVIVESQMNMSWIGSPAENGLSSINPNDIESIEVLKDASATAIYGARGANGVVLITTKKGKVGNDNLSFSAYVGLQTHASEVNVMNASQFARLYDEAGYNANPDGYRPLYPNPDSLGAGTDWQNEIYRSAPIQNYTLTFTGGNEKTKYAISGDYFTQDGIIKGSDFQRISFRINFDRKVNKWLNIGTNLTFNNTVSNTVPTDTPGGFFPGVVNTALTFSPVLPVYDEDGNYTLTDPNADAWLDNPVAVTNDVDAVSKINRLLGNVYAEFLFTKGLTFRSSVGADIYRHIQDMYTPRYVYSGSFNDGQARFATTDATTMLFDNTLTYTNTFNDLHTLTVVGGTSFQKVKNRSYIDISTGFPNDILSYYGIENAENMPDIYTAFTESAIVSFYTRLNYNFKQRYLFTVTGRVDGSSRFGSNNRYAFFPSAAFAWRMAQEDFIKNLNVFSDLKFRVSYGYSGNERIGDYQYISTLGSTIYYFNNAYPATGFAPSNPGNANLGWETTTQFDVGLDFGFIDDRLTFTTDYYYKKTFDLLYWFNLPWSTGFNSYMKNIGTLQNQGFEFMVSSANFVKEFKWNTDFNISFNKNKVLDLNGGELYVNNDTYKLKIGNWAVIREGEEMGSFFGLQSDGIWQTEDADEAAVYGAEPGDFKYIDQNQDGKIDADDRLIIGQALPDFHWGFNNTFSYKGFSLDIFFQGVHGNQILNSNRFELESGNGLSNAGVDMLDRWTPENPSNIYPRANRAADYLHMSDRYLEDGSFVKMKTLTFGYDLPLKTVSRMNLNKLKFYFTVQNVFTITKYTGFDPEVSRFGQDNTRLGYDYGGYPSSRTYILGLMLNL